MTMSQKFGILSIILQIQSPIKQRHLSSDWFLLYTSNQFVNILSSGKMHILPANFNSASLITLKTFPYFWTAAGNINL
jgi:hypothetical protein